MAASPGDRFILRNGATGAAPVPTTPPAPMLAGRRLMSARLALTLLLFPLAALADEPARWDFLPPREGDESLIDLRHLNEKTAGESGFVTVDAQGDFRTGDGKPVRFWAVNTTV